MSHVFEHRPTHEGMGVLGHPQVFVGHKCVAAIRALVCGGPTLDDPSLDARRGKHQVKDSLDPRMARNLFPLRPSNYFLATAFGALTARDLDASIDSQPLVLVPPRPLLLLLQYLARPDEHSLSLVIKVSAFSNVFEVGMEESDSSRSVLTTKPVNFLH